MNQKPARIGAEMISGGEAVKYLIYLVMFVFLAPMLFVGRVGAREMQEIEEWYSFESDFEGWAIRSNQSEPGLPPPVTHSQERSTDGLTSLEFEINREAIFQVVWIEKVFDVKPNQIYDAIIDYSFASRDCCHSNPSGIVTGVLNQSPGLASRDLIAAKQGEADNGETTLSDYKWLNKQFAFTTRTNEQGKLYAVIGVGAGEFTRTYFLDKVHIKIVERPGPWEFYSFENDLEGWAARATDYGADSNPPSWSILPNDLVFLEGKTSLQFTVDSANHKPKLWVEKAYVVEPKKRYRVKIEYSFFSQEDVPNSKIFAGALNRSPQVAEDLEPFYQESVGAYDRVWRRYQYEFTVKAKKGGLLYVFIGIFARQQKYQAFNFDNVCISVVPK
jgi:hypothetical protein